MLKVLTPLSKEKEPVLRMISLRYPIVLVKLLQHHEAMVAASCSKIIANSLSYSEDVDRAYVDEGLVESIVSLYKKQRLKESKPLRECASFMIANLLCSSEDICKRVIESNLMYDFLVLFTEEQNFAVSSKSS